MMSSAVSARCSAIEQETVTAWLSSKKSQKEILSHRAARHVKDRLVNLPRHEFACYRLDHFPKFDKAELMLGQVLGQGNFGIVNEIRGVKLRSMQTAGSEIQDERDTSISVEEGQSSKKMETEDVGRHFVQQQCLKTASRKGSPTSTPRYASSRKISHPQERMICSLGFKTLQRKLSS